MAVLTPFFDVVAGVAILAGRSSLLDKGVFKTANTNFTVRHLLALGFIGYGGWNLWKIERAQDKLKKTLDAESFGADKAHLPPYFYEGDRRSEFSILRRNPDGQRTVVATIRKGNASQAHYWRGDEARARRDANRVMWGATLKERLTQYREPVERKFGKRKDAIEFVFSTLGLTEKDFEAESFGAEPSYRGSGDLYDCGCAVDDYEDDWNISCESCGYVSCLDCHYVDSTDVNPQNWKCYEGYGCNKGAESFSADTIKTGVICGDNGCKGELLETEYGKASKVHCDKCDYSEIMEWNAESFGAEINVSMADGLWYNLVYSSRMGFIDLHQGEMNLPLMIRMGAATMPENIQELGALIGESTNDTGRLLANYAEHNGWITPSMRSDICELGAESFGAEFHDLDSDHEKYGESPPVRKEGFTPIGVYYVEGVGYCTGVAWAEKQAASFTDKPPVFYDWEYICDTCTYEEDECECGLDAYAVMWEGKDDDNDGLIYGIEYMDGEEVSDVEWFKTSDERDAELKQYISDFGAEAFGGENLPHAYPELREYVFTNEESMEFDELIEARMRAAKEEGLEDWENDSNAHLLSGHIQDLIWEHDDFGAESLDEVCEYGNPLFVLKGHTHGYCVEPSCENSYCVTERKNE